MLNVGAYSPMNVTIDALSDEPYFIAEDVQYFSMLSGLYFVRMIEVTEDAGVV